MAIDDRFAKSLEHFDKEFETDIPKKAVSLVIALIPHVGNEINLLLFKHAQQRVTERIRDVFEAVGERMKQIDETKIDREFFKSDEFMTLLILAIEQLQTTHDKQKLQMLANAIANSGVVGFSSDSRKELFIRIFRDLAPEHVAMLDWMRLKPPPRANVTRGIAREMKDPKGPDLAVLQSLAAQGLVDEYQERERPSISISSLSNERDAKRAIEELIMAPFKRCFRINQFGEDFLKYFDPQIPAPVGRD